MNIWSQPYVQLDPNMGGLSAGPTQTSGTSHAPSMANALEAQKRTSQKISEHSLQLLRPWICGCEGQGVSLEGRCGWV